MSIKVKTESHDYHIYINSGLLKEIELPESSFIITDKNVKKHYGKYFKNYPQLAIQPGEKYKRLSTIEELVEQLVELGADRNSTLVAVGGGVVGDMTGFLASIYMRGIDFIQIPTSLLAMVDASVGGKTGVDINKGKNLIGSFFQPDSVIIDPDVLDTLPEREFKSGMAEVIKHGIIDGGLFKWINKRRDKIKDLDKDVLGNLIQKNIYIKKKIVEKDEKEQGIRAILNLGHTFGHAIESLSEYKTSHGAAVAKGIVKSAELASFKKLDALIDMFNYFEINYKWPDSKKYTFDKVIAKMLADKKTKNKEITLVLPLKFGKVEIFKNFDQEKIKQCLNQ